MKLSAFFSSLIEVLLNNSVTMPAGRRTGRLPGRRSSRLSVRRNESPGSHDTRSLSNDAPKCQCSLSHQRTCCANSARCLASISHTNQPADDHEALDKARMPDFKSQTHGQRGYSSRTCSTSFAIIHWSQFSCSSVISISVRLSLSSGETMRRQPAS